RSHNVLSRRRSHRGQKVEENNIGRFFNRAKIRACVRLPPPPMRGHERVATEVKRVRSPLERVEAGAISSARRMPSVATSRPSMRARRLKLAHLLQHGERNADIAHNSQRAEIGNNLA